jgi:hypothetical protein
MSNNNDGQHRSVGNSSAPGTERGMRGVRNPAAEVGNANGPEANMRVPAAKRGAEIDTTTGSAGPRAVGETRGSVDD